LFKFFRSGWPKDDHSWDGAEQVKEALMGFAVVVDKAGAIEGKECGRVLEGYVVDDMIDGPLDEGGIDCYYRPEALGSEAGGKGNGVFFGDA
jgi:hypothetical protein